MLIAVLIVIFIALAVFSVRAIYAAGYDAALDDCHERTARIQREKQKIIDSK